MKNHIIHLLSNDCILFSFFMSHAASKTIINSKAIDIKGKD